LWRKVPDTNLVSAAMLTQTAVGHMPKGGAIVYIASVMAPSAAEPPPR
jgi:NAD(P)-dependent dehydrogenase (short-subunit alcohol dehydrogenase family)